MHVVLMMHGHPLLQLRTCINCISSLLNKSIVIGLPSHVAGAIYAGICIITARCVARAGYNHQQAACDWRAKLGKADLPYKHR